MSSNLPPGMMEITGSGEETLACPLCAMRWNVYYVVEAGARNYQPDDAVICPNGCVIDAAATAALLATQDGGTVGDQIIGVPTEFDWALSDRCSVCKGDGYVDDTWACLECGGTGRRAQVCPSCIGSGRHWAVDGSGAGAMVLCRDCDGHGHTVGQRR